MSDSEATAIIFVCGDRSFTVRDVIDAALFRGELEPEWKNLLRLKPGFSYLAILNQYLRSIQPLHNVANHRTLTW